MPLRDVFQTAHDPRVDWERMGSWASRWHLGAALAHGFALAERELGAELPAAARPIAESVPARAEVRAIRAYTADRRSGGMALAATRAIPGMRAKSVYLFGLLLPSREFLRARGGAGASYLSRWSVPVHWIGRRRRRIGERSR
jgi:hypothetical protein